jgi:DNA repair protein RadC
MSELQFKEFKGFVGELSATYKRTSKESVRVTSSGSINNFIRPYFDEIMDDHEQLKVIYLSNNLSVLNVKDVSKGGLTSTLCDIRLVIREALMLPTTAIVLVHNHPSGTLRPSSADDDLVKKLKKAADYFDIKVLDSIILTRESYYSYADEGLI